MLDERYLSQFPAHRGRLVRAAMRLLGGRAEAEDAVQDTYLRALESGRDVHELDAAQAWLTTVMQHLAIDRLRRRNWMQAWLQDAETRDAASHEAPSAEDDAALAESTAQALRLLAARLSPPDAAAVLLREVFEASFKEIASASGKTESACRQQLHRALLRLRTDTQRKPEARYADEESDTTLHLLRQSLQARDPQLLLALLRSPAIRGACLPPSTGVAKAAPKVVCRIAQVGGRLGLVLTLGGQLVCVLPLGVRATHEDESGATALHG